MPARSPRLCARTRSQAPAIGLALAVLVISLGACFAAVVFVSATGRTADRFELLAVCWAGTSFLCAAVAFRIARRAISLVARAGDLYRAVCDGTTDAIFVKDAAGKYLLFNEAAGRLVGRPADTVVGKDDFALFDPASARAVVERDRRVMAGGRAETEEEVLTAAGVTRAYLATKAPYRDESGRVVGLIGVSRDVTASKEAELALKASEARLQALIRAVPDMIFRFDAAGEFIDHKTESDEDLIVPPEQFLGRHYRDVLPTRVAGRFAEVIAAAAASQAVESFEYELDLPRSAKQHFEARVLVALDGGTVVAARNISTRKRADLFLARQNAILEQIATGQPLARILAAITAALEEQLPGGLCSILLLDRDGTRLRHGAGESLPPEYNAAIDGVQIGPCVGSCGTAAFRREPVFVSDIAADPLWAAFRDLALSHGLRACWSSPIRSAARGDGRVLGTFAVYARTPGAPPAAYAECVTRVEYLAGVAIEADRAARDLRESEARFRVFVDNATDAMFVHDATGAVVDVNRRACEALGYAREELIGLPPMAFDPDVTPADVKSIMARLEASEEFGFETRHRHRDGGAFPVEIRVRPFRVSGLLHCLALVRDITERRKAERALRESEERFAQFMQHLPGLAWVKDAGGRFTYANAEFLRAFGHGRPSVEGLTDADLLPPDAVPTTTTSDRRVLTGRAAIQIVESVPHADGSAQHFMVSKFPIPGPDGEVAQVGGVAIDITDRQLAEDRLRESEGRFRTMFELATVGIAQTDPASGRFVLVNDRFCQITGYPREELLGLTVPEVTHPEDRDADWTLYQQAISGGRPQYINEKRYLRKDGTVVWVRINVAFIRDESGRAVRTMAVIEDITERNRLEAQFRQAQKTEAIGRLAGGIAHDFNNMLTVIIGHADLLLLDLPAEDGHRARVDAVRDAAERAARVTQHLLAYGRKAVIAPKVLDLNDLVVRAQKLLRPILGEHILLGAALDPDVTRVKADRSHLEQVFVNLMINSRDAMPGGGRLTVATKNAFISPADAQGSSELQSGWYAVATVTDTGCGMTPEVRANAFEPFFTTKGVGKGTGLGLAMVHGAMKQIGGHVGVESELGVGTTFTLYFPSVSEPSPAAPPTPPPAAPRGTETVLLVEDEDPVRMVARYTLERQGYRVIEATGGREAIRLAEDHEEAIDLLLTDVVMPEVGGREVAESLRGRPGLRVLFMSGHTDDAVLQHGVVDGRDEYLQKPFTPNQLATKVRSILDGSFHVL